MSVSVLVLTLNEESNIEPCLSSLGWSDDLVVLDSNSTDRTAELAQHCGARVYRREFDNWSSHQNWAVANIEFRNPWVLYLDADERCPEELRDEVRVRAAPQAEAAAFRMRRKDFFMGRWLRYAQLYPTWLVRMFRPERIRYERLVNPVAVVDGPTFDLQAHIIHYPFSHGVGHWIARHNRYSEMEAQEMFAVRMEGRRAEGSVFSRDPNERRKALKDLFFRMPGRPWVKFLYYYAARRGFLDGRAGLTYSALQAMYEYMIDLKFRELVRRQAGLPL